MIGSGFACLAAIMAANFLEVSVDETISYERSVVDQWLIKNNLNQFGDPQGTVYANEMPSDPKERYTYLVEKFPDKPWRNTFEYIQTYNTRKKERYLGLIGYCAGIFGTVLLSHKILRKILDCYFTFVTKHLHHCD